MSEIDTNETKEFSVVISSNTVVEPQTVMIEAFYTLVALRAMFGGRVDPFVTYSTSKDFLSNITTSFAL